MQVYVLCDNTGLTVQAHLHLCKNAPPVGDVGCAGHDSIGHRHTLAQLNIQNQVVAAKEAVCWPEALHIHVHVDAAMGIQDEVPNGITCRHAKPTNGTTSKAVGMQDLCSKAACVNASLHKQGNMAVLHLHTAEFPLSHNVQSANAKG